MSGTGFDLEVRKVLFSCLTRLSANSAYLCVLCVIHNDSDDFTQSTQRYAEFAEDLDAAARP